MLPSTLSFEERMAACQAGIAEYVECSLNATDMLYLAREFARWQSFRAALGTMPPEPNTLAHTISTVLLSSP
jgi:hypothetical protein